MKGIRIGKELAVGDAIKQLEAMGYVIISAHREPLCYRRFTEDQPLFEAMNQFRWEAVHMIARQLEPKHLSYEQGDKTSWGITMSAKLYIGG